MIGPPTYYLSAHSFCCELEDGAIILELATGAYVGVHAEYLPDLRVVIRNWPNSAQADFGVAYTTTTAVTDKLIADLLARGILTTSPANRRSRHPAPPSAALTITDAALSKRWIPLRHLAQFLTALFCVAMRHRDKKLAAQLDWFEQRQRSIRTGRSPAISCDVSKLLASFVRLRIWLYTAERRCLFDSLVLALFLTRELVPCSFVIGVSTKPFLAHSWVQIGELVINDTVEHVQMFTPILALGESD